MMAAAAPTPAKPFGMNGDQLAGFTANAPTAMKNSTTAILIATIMLVTRALSLMPMINKTGSASTISAAGRLMMPPSKGVLMSATGRGMPTLSMILTRSTENPIEPATQAQPYSNARFQ